MQLDLKGIDWPPTCRRVWNLGRNIRYGGVRNYVTDNPSNLGIA